MEKTMIRFASFLLALILMAAQIPFGALAAENCCCGHPECPAYQQEAVLPETGMISAGNYHSVYLSEDGYVYAAGTNKPGKSANRGGRCDVEYWEGIVAISAASHTVGLKADGSVVATGVNTYGQCDVGTWRDMVAVSAGDHHTVGLRDDGTVVAVGDNEYGQCQVRLWKDIIQVEAGLDTTYGLTEDGRVCWQEKLWLRLDGHHRHQRRPLPSSGPEGGRHRDPDGCLRPVGRNYR